MSKYAQNIRPARMQGEFAPKPSSMAPYGNFQVDGRSGGGGYGGGGSNRGGSSNRLPPGGPLLDPLPASSSRSPQRDARAATGKKPVTKEIWKQFSDRLPTSKDADARKRREQLFSQIDMNGNGYLSLAEVDKGVRDILGLDALFNAKPVMMRAFQAAKNVGQPKSNLGADYVERKEFRLLLCYLRQYFEFKEMFDKLDTDSDHRIDYTEFLAGAKYLKNWGARIGEPLKVFKSMDGNKGGKVLFDEFADWAIKAKLDLEDDDDFAFDYSQEMKRIGNNIASVPKPQASSPHNNHQRSPQANNHRSPQRRQPADSRARTGKAIDWAHMANKLPVDDSKEAKEKRKMLFKLMDFNGNGFLSLAEIDKGVRDVLDCDYLFDAKPAIMRAYKASKNSRTGAKNNSDYVEPGEFRLLLIWLRQYFEFMVMFRKIDTSHDNRIDYGEFQQALPYLRRWGAKVEDANAAFKAMDRNGGGIVLFDEFATWAIQYKLDLEDDLDFDYQKAIEQGGYQNPNFGKYGGSGGVRDGKVNQQTEEKPFRAVRGRPTDQKNARGPSSPNRYF